MNRFSSLHAGRRLLVLAIACFLVALPAAAQPWDDEPDELSWQHLAGHHEVFGLWADWFGRQEAATQQRLTQAARQAGLSATTPTAPSLWIQGEAFGPTAGWQVANHEGRRVLRGPAGHNATPVRVMIDLPQAGVYRLWTRWFNMASHHASMTVRVRPAQAMDQSHRLIVPDEADWLSHRVGFVPFKRKNEMPLAYEVSRRGFQWDGSPLFELPAGQAVIEIAGMTHGGPYAHRLIDMLVLAADPLFIPGEEDLPDSQADQADTLVVQRPASAQADAARRQLWAMRPGVKPWQEVPVPLAEAWHAFRRELVERLAAQGDGLSQHEKHLTQFTYFDERWNLVGTPAQVAARVAELHSPQMRVEGYFQWVEAEDFKIENGWSAVRDGTASLSGALQATYSNGPAKATHRLVVPQAGDHRLWVRYARIRGYHNTFEVTLSQAGKTVHEAKFHEMPPSDVASGYQYVWHAMDVTLAAGAHDITLTKNIGKPPYAYRKIDCVVLTSHLPWQPDAGNRPVVPGKDNRWFAWQGEADDHWTGFSQASRPLRDGQVIDAPVKLDVQPGAMGQRAIHLTNDTDAPVTLQPTIQGSLPAQWRVAAYQYHPSFSWQPMPLLRRHEVTLPPGLTTTLWVNIDARQTGPGQHQVTLDLGQGRVVAWQVNVTGADIRQAPTPLVGGWMSPPHRSDSYEILQDIGLNVLHGRVVSKAMMERYGIRLAVLILGKPDSVEAVTQAVQAIHARGLDYADWAWEIADEPSAKNYKAWIEAAKIIRQADPKVRIWCNPGEIQSSTAEAVTAMSPYIDVFCPYVNHFGSKDTAYQKLLAQTGSPKLLYTTPCFREKSPGAPLELLALADLAIRHQRDGWDAFSLMAYYPYAASAWDEVNSPFPDQAVSLYPGAHGRLIGSRNIEAVRQAIVVYKTHHASAR